MFSNFQVGAAAAQQQQQQPQQHDQADAQDAAAQHSAGTASPARLGRPTNKPPGGTAHACEPCRRRKSRCDGGPGRVCSRCAASRKEQQCVYMGHKPRNIPSQKLVDELANSLTQHRSVFETLFPNINVARLGSMTREDLLKLLNNDQIAEEFREQKVQVDSPGVIEPSSDNSNVLEQLQDVANEYDEGSSDVLADSDDVNALGLSVSQYSSYVGSSSISAALKIIAIICPGVMQQQNLLTAQSPTSSIRSHRDLAQYVNTQVPPHVEATFVDAYFMHVHPLHPMVNEHQFRHQYATGINQKRSWLGLVNMVLAMGSIAAGTSMETTHIIYYQRARKSLTYDSFGSGRLETVQALALMGGLYLHYCNRPNMAVAVTGAAMRMAYALGVHRRTPALANQGFARPDPNSDAEVRRRTWWTLVCLDTWGSTTLGRPATGDCFGPGITTPHPVETDFAGHPLQPKMQFLAACVEFTQIAANMQDRLATKPCLGVSEMASFDARLNKAFQSLPMILNTSQPCPRDLQVPRAILKWRFQNARMLLHRPTLLAAALTRKLPHDMTEADQQSIAMCRAIAADTIMDISCDWRQEHICGWNGAWMLFQAVMVPLVSLYYEPNNAAETGRWRHQVEMAMRLLEAMGAWSPVANKSREVVAQLYDQSGGMHQMMPDLSAWDPQAPFDMQEAWAANLSAQVADWSNFAFDPVAYG